MSKRTSLTEVILHARERRRETITECAANATRKILELPSRRRKPEAIAAIIATEFESLVQG
jgi:hypothetical protein